MYKEILLFISFLLYLSSNGTDVTDDYVDPTLRITSPQIISIKVGLKFSLLLNISILVALQLKTLI